MVLGGAQDGYEKIGPKVCDAGEARIYDPAGEPGNRC